MVKILEIISPSLLTLQIILLYLIILDSWAVSEGLDLRREPWINQYIISVYWSLSTACSVGYGDIHAHLLMEKVLALFCMIAGVVFFGYIIASVTASLSNADSARAMYKSKVCLIFYIFCFRSTRLRHSSIHIFS